MRYLPLTLLLVSPNLFAQDALDAIARSICEQMNGLDKTTLTTESAQMQLGLFMLTAAQPYTKELKKKYKFDLAAMEEGSGEKLGEMVGMRMAGICPEVFVYLMDNTENDASASAGGTKENVRTAFGTIQSVTPGQFLTINLKTDDGPSYELILLEHVMNIEQVTEDPLKARGFHAKWNYVDREFFDPYTRTYKTYRVLTGMEP